MNKIRNAIAGLGLVAVLNACQPKSYLGVVPCTDQTLHFTDGNDKVSYSTYGAYAIGARNGKFSVEKKDKQITYYLHIRNEIDNAYLVAVTGVNIIEKRTSSGQAFRAFDQSVLQKHPDFLREVNANVARYAKALTPKLVKETNERANNDLLARLR